MAMLAHVRAEAGWAPIQSHLPKQPASHKHAQAIVDGRERNFGHPPLYAIKNLVSSRVIVASSNHFEHFASLAGKAKARRLE